MDHDIDRWVSAASAVLQAFCQSVEVKMERSQKVTFLIYRLTCHPALSYGH